MPRYWSSSVRRMRAPSQTPIFQKSAMPSRYLQARMRNKNPLTAGIVHSTTSGKWSPRSLRCCPEPKRTPLTEPAAALLLRRNTTLGTRVVEGCTLRAAISGVRLAETLRTSGVTVRIGARSLGGLHADMAEVGGAGLGLLMGGLMMQDIGVEVLQHHVVMRH